MVWSYKILFKYELGFGTTFFPSLGHNILLRLGHSNGSFLGCDNHLGLGLAELHNISPGIHNLKRKKKKTFHQPINKKLLNPNEESK